ncbi:MAG: penicillin-binding protein [Bdellovibrionota bacterium]
MNPKRIKALQLAFIVFASLIVGRAIQLQVGADSRLERLAKRQFGSKITALPRRGLIFDRNGEGLAISLKVRSLFFRPEILKKEVSASERTRILFNLNRILKMPLNELRSKMNSERGFVWVKRQLTENEEQSIRRLGLIEYGDSIGLAEETKRFYPNKDLAAHVLGTVNVDGNGLEGLEFLYEGILNGDEARITSNKDAMGRRIFKDDRGLLAFRDGQSLVLTLDKALQYEAEKGLKQAIDDYQAKSGSVIVAEVETGEILALANTPTYNPNNAKSASLESRRNRAITDAYEPGSTFKPFMVAMALEKGRTPKTQIYCERGSFKVGDRIISEAEAHEKFEWLSLGQILKFSSNIGAAKIALDLGPAPVTQLMDRLGVGKKTEIDLPGEASGFIDHKELRSPVRLANVGFGHGFTVTPLQMLTYYLALANGGHWIQPKLVKAILSEDPDSLERGAIRWKLGHRFDNPKNKKIFSPKIASQITTMLETVVEEEGTGIKAQLAEWPVAGKTGTAQKIDQQTFRYSKSKYIVSFAGFAPAKNPKLVALVVLDEPQKKLYASDTAAPTFREIMRAGLLRERVPPTDSKVRLLQLANKTSIDGLKASAFSATQKTKPADFRSLEKPSKTPKGIEQATSLELEVDEKQSRVRLPDLTGLTLRESLKVIGSQPLEIEVVGSGFLREQNPAANQWLKAGSKIKLVFGNK